MGVMLRRPSVRVGMILPRFNLEKPLIIYKNTSAHKLPPRGLAPVSLQIPPGPFSLGDGVEAGVSDCALR
jgi:hypothetical protein